MEDVAIRVPGGGHVNAWHRPGERPVVLIHGLTGTSRWWTRVIRQLPPERGLVAIDVRGRGESVGSAPPFDMFTLADDVALYLDHLDIDEALIAGYSMGGWIAAIFGHRHPERATSLLLVDGGLRLPLDDSVDADTHIEAVVGPALARLGLEFESEAEFIDHWKAHPALVDHWDDSMAAPLAHELSRRGDKLVVSINPDAVRVNAAEITVDPITRDAGATLGVPAHVIVVERGTADQPGGMVPRQTAADAVAANSNLSMDYHTGLNHYTLLLGDGADQVAAAIAAR